MELSEFHTQLERAVREAVGRVEVCEAIEGLYGEIEGELGRIRPRCSMSGRCCHFEEYGHRLYVTTAELAAVVRRAKALGAIHGLAMRPDGGSCRFQEGKMCMAHGIRPMGCRLFFCDESAEEQLQALYERFHGRVKELHERFGVPYYYVEWRSALASVERMITEPTRPGDSPRS
jgi:Fe-S-cluster containining protein